MNRDRTRSMQMPWRLEKELQKGDSAKLCASHGDGSDRLWLFRYKKSHLVDVDVIPLFLISIVIIFIFCKIILFLVHHGMCQSTYDTKKQFFLLIFLSIFQPTCTDCGGTVIEYDVAAGNGFCVRCGTVVEENTIVNEIAFGETSSGAAMVQGSYVAQGASTHDFLPNSGPFID